MASAPAAEAIPDHVPPELVWNRSFDAYTAEGDERTGGNVDLREQIDFAREYACEPADPAAVAAAPK